MTSLDSLAQDMLKTAGLYCTKARLCVIKALLLALLEPTKTLQTLELDGDFTGRLALIEDLKTMPFGAVWDEYCKRSDVAGAHVWLDEVRSYEKEVLSKRTTTA